MYEGVLQYNPASRVRLPKVEKYKANFYEIDELHELLKCSRGTTIELSIMLAVYYRLRRSEVAGLKWSAIDLKRRL